MIGHRGSPCFTDASAAAEPGAELQSPPPRTGRGVAGHAFDRPLALAKPVDTSEADGYLLVRTQPKQARRHRSIPAAPTPVLRVFEIATDRRSNHDDTSI
jgi:hypothetical protein